MAAKNPQNDCLLPAHVFIDLRLGFYQAVWYNAENSTMNDDMSYANSHVYSDMFLNTNRIIPSSGRMLSILNIYLYIYQYMHTIYSKY